MTEPATPKREWCAYIRVSKLMGREKSDGFVSPAQQETKIRAALKSKCNAEPVEVWTDLDKTGTDDNRPEFAQAIAWVEADPSRRGIAVMDGSRLFRNAELFMSTVKRLEQKGAEYLSAHLLLDAKTPEGSLMRNMDAVINEFFSANVGRRWRMVQDDRVKEGLPSGGPARFGYEAVESIGKDGKAVRARVHTPHPEHSKVLRQMYLDFIGGMGAQRLALAMNTRGIKTGRGNIWSLQTVLRTLDSGFAAGLLRVVQDGEAKYLPGAHDAIITSEEWEAYRRARETRKRIPSKRRNARWHLAGIARCGLCGEGMIVQSHAANPNRTLVLCSGYHNGKGCSGVWVKKAEVEWVFTMWLGTQASAVGRTAAEARRRDKAHALAVDARDAAAAEVERLTREAVALVRDRASSTAPAVYDEAIRQSEADLAEAQGRLEDAIVEAERLTPVPAEGAWDQLSAWADEQPEADPAAFNALLKKVCERVEVRKDGFTLVPVVGKPRVVGRQRVKALSHAS